jgi:hypothetical protein
MIRLAEIERLGQCYPSGSLTAPAYVLAGGTGVQYWLRDTTLDRPHRNLTLFCFTPDFLSTLAPKSQPPPTLFVGTLTRSGKIIPSGAPFQVEVCRGAYFDSEILPSLADALPIRLAATPLFALSLEFLVMSKLSYPNVHRSVDLHDVLALLQHGCLRDMSLLSRLLEQTTLGQMMAASEVWKLSSPEAMQAVLRVIHRHIIRRFLHCTRFQVEALTLLQSFVLLDLDPQGFEVPPQTLSFIETLVYQAGMEGRDVQHARLGLYLLTMALPPEGAAVLEHPDLHELLRRALALLPGRSDVWLSRSKLVWSCFRHMARLERCLLSPLPNLWSAAAVIQVVQRVFFTDPSAHIYPTAVKAALHDLQQQVLTPEQLSSRLALLPI